MMDRERQEKDLQEVFEAIQGAYWAAIENAFSLQQQTIEFARRLIEAPAAALQIQAENNRATLEILSEQSRKQRKAIENLLGESYKVYESLLQTPFSHHQIYPEFEEAMQAPEMSSEGR